MRPITVLIVDSHPLFIEGLSSYLSLFFQRPNILKAGKLSEATRIINNGETIDWIFTEMDFPDGNGLALLSWVRQHTPCSRSVLISSCNDLGVIYQALQLGIRGYIDKSEDKKSILEGLKKISLGHTYLHADVVAAIEQYRATTLTERERIIKKLSPRKKEILVLMAEGYSNEEIRKSLCISESTIKGHVSELLRLLAADNRTQCVAEARLLNLI